MSWAGSEFTDGEQQSQTVLIYIYVYIYTHTERKAYGKSFWGQASSDFQIKLS